MESSRPDTELVNEVEGVRLRKTLEEEEYNLPSIEYELASERDETVEIAIRDPIPEAVSIEDIGFHRDYGKDYWDVDGDELVLEHSLEPKDDFKTVYAFRADEMDVTGDLLIPPNSVEVSPSAPSVPDPKEMGSSEKSPAQTGSPNSGGQSEPGENGTEIEKTDVSSAIETVDVESEDRALIDRLARELQNDVGKSESFETLREHLLETNSPDGSAKARLSQLQEDVSNLRAYTNALEEFLDDEGTSQEILDRYEDRVNAMEAELNSLESTTNTLAEKLQTVETEVQQVSGSVESMSDDIDALEADINSLDKDVASIDERLPEYSIDKRFSQLEEKLEDVSDFVEGLKSAFEQP